MKYPRSPHEKIDGIVYFGRMVDKIRLQAAGELPSDLHANLGTGFDERCCDFLHVSYEALKTNVSPAISDTQALEWCFQQGRKPSEQEREIWSEFMRKRGWNDEASIRLAQRKRESGFEDRDDIQTFFDYIDLDEGRDPRAKVK